MKSAVLAHATIVRSQTMPSLYARYIKEREGFDIIESTTGFATYQVQGTVCYLRDLYVLPDNREAGAASALADEVCLVARKAGCTSLMGTISCSAANSDRNLRVLLAYGMSVTSAHEGYLVLGKSLET